MASLRKTLDPADRFWDDPNLTAALHAAAQGSSAASERVWSSSYPRLRQRASVLHGRRGRTSLPSPTELVHESFRRLQPPNLPTCGDRRHFLRLATRAMRQALIDASRRHANTPRPWPDERMAEIAQGDRLSPAELCDLHDALRELRSLNPRQARVVELRYLCGCSVAETAARLDISSRTVNLEWAKARLWLFDHLAGTGCNTDST